MTQPVKPSDLTWVQIDCYIKALVVMTRQGDYMVWAYQTLRDHNDDDDNWRETIFMVMTTPTRHLTAEEVVWRSVAGMLLAAVHKA